MARCAGQGVKTGNVSGSCASRRMGWRDAPFQNSKLNRLTTVVEMADKMVMKKW
ncbi:hypothetical protein A2U01_0068854, partial [Trifolium medium]|nr:hypothetical protein [Trifolium medium]